MLNEQIGAEFYRLPTEAEWAYAARAGTTTKFEQGKTLSKEQANFTRFFQGTATRFRADPDRYGVPLPVDVLDAANAWGLRHMSGNVFEWTISCFSKPHLGLATSAAYLENA